MINTDNTTSNNYSMYRLAKGIAAGTATYVGTLLALAVPHDALFTVNAPNLSKDKRVEEIRKALNNMIIESGLKEHGVNIMELKAPKVYKSYWQILSEHLKLIFSKEYRYAKKHDPKAAKKMLNNVLLQKYIHGFNACFYRPNNLVLLNMEKKGITGFHELGHALNKQSFIWHFIQKNGKNYANKFVPIILLTSLLIPKSKKNKEDRNFLENSGQFIKNNAGKLAVAAFLPTITEECEATRKGLIYAKKFLSPQLYKKTLCVSTFGSITYLIFALARGLGVYLANKVKDRIVEKQ